MQKTITDLEKKFSSLKTGRANPDMLNIVQVEYYGSIVPIKQLASISVNEGTQLILNVFDVLETRERLLIAENLIIGDKYDFVRDAYLQSRDYLVKDGEIEDDFLIDLEIDFFDSPE